MKIFVLNGSPRLNGNTAAMVSAFAEGAKEKGHTVDVVNVCQKQIAGCLGCEYCHTSGGGKCIQQDDMEEVYALWQEADMVVFASPIYYFHFSGQLQCAITRIYAKEFPPKLKKTALILSSGSDHVYDAAIHSWREGFVKYMKLEDMGVFTAHGGENKSPRKLAELRSFGKSL